jgi:ABC-type multidrug transport system fused ATPase/permease subunit
MWVLLHRFAADVDMVDNGLAGTFTGVLQPGFQLLSIAVVVEMAVPPFFLFYLPVMYFYVKYAQLYRASGREIKRLNSNSKSPIFQLFNETLNGLTSVRAFGARARFLARNETYIDANATTLKCADTAIRWFAMRLQLCSALIVLVTTLFITMQTGTLDAATAGLALSYALTSTLVLQGVIQTFTQLEVIYKLYTSYKFGRPLDFHKYTDP